MSILSENIGRMIEEAVERDTRGKDIAVAFSGGLDSGLVAALTKRYASSVTLYTAGTVRCSDGTETRSFDAVVAEGAASALGMRWEHIEIETSNLEKDIEEMIRITGTTDPLTISFELPLFHVCSHCSEDLIIGGQGADELFAGYSKYVGLKDGDLKEAIGQDLSRLYEVTMPHERKVADHFGKRILYPYLSVELTEFMKEVDMDALVPNEGIERKALLRDVARDTGHYDLAAREKKAAQYGSGTMNAIRRLCKDKGMTYGELVDGIVDRIGR